MLIGITGRAGAGKDTVADYLVRHHGLWKLSWAGPLKCGLREMGFPEPADRDEKEAIIPGFDFSWRQAAQRLGTEWGRSLDPDIWIKLMARQLDTLDTISVVIADVRFENEAAMIRSRGGYIWHIVGRQADLGAEAAHASEAGVEFHASHDWTINNNGILPDLYFHVEQLLRKA